MSIEDLEGHHNRSLEQQIRRLEKARSYKDLSTIWICVTRGMIHSRVVGSWMNLMRPMNQKILGPVFVEGLEVGHGYNAAVEMVMGNPELSKWKYLLTVEEDNCPPSDGLLKLYEGIEKFDVVSGLYWTKGEAGMPMIYGNPGEMPRNYIPQMPHLETLQACNGLGMGFNLFKLEMFKKIPPPWFRTVQEPGRQYTQDLFFFEQAAVHGFKFACDTRIKVGHFDAVNNMMW